MSHEPSNQSMRDHFESIELKREEVTTIVTPPFLPAFAEAFIDILTAHNIRVDDRTSVCYVTFPAHTTKTELLPRTYDERYRILLPDGFELCEVRRRGQNYSYLHCDAATLTPEQRRRLQGTS